MRRLLFALALTAAPAFAQDVSEQNTYAALRSTSIPVTEGDVLDRPYRVIGVVQANVRQNTIFGGTPSRQKVFSELWERAVKLGADAVVHARYGEGRITAWSWNARQAEGKAIKFLTPAEIQARKPAQ